METLARTGFERRRILVRGIVQGVGFRPFVYREAKRLGLTGWVLNDSKGVTIEVEGEPTRIDEFVYALHDNRPDLARIQTIHCDPASVRGDTDFKIKASEAHPQRHVPISPDVTVCPDCLRELFDPEDRRYLYPFINCTNCGPRFTIVQDVPYDRAKTTMRLFRMCPECQEEYANPVDRRYHAQPNACPECGPEVFLLHENGEHKCSADGIAVAAQKLATGEILAIKGLGGYHLACDAMNEEAVSLLRHRKHRYDKPFALMVPDLDTAKIVCEIGEQEAQLLQSRRRPIVLLRKKTHCCVASEVAPNYRTLGVMLPYTPLHYLLLAEFARRLGPEQPPVLVMTSGNLSDEPIAYRDPEARQRLFPIIEAMLSHNRDIRTRCDDSVVHVTSAGAQILRRSRGYAPEPITTKFRFPVPVLATGGHLKNTFCVAKDHHAYLSPHIGDLENLETLTSFRETVDHFQRLFDIEPEVVVYDLHPEYLATKFALERQTPRKIGVQHHHAHVASVLAEHGIDRSVIGISADGTGYGTDGAIWGCEIMVAELAAFTRRVHLDYVPMPGGEQAIRQPWRMAAVFLCRAFGDGFLDLDIPFVKQLPAEKWRTLAQMIDKQINCPMTSSLGRLFDAVAALLGFHAQVRYEGQAAIELEMQAAESGQPYLFDLADGTPARVDATPMIRAIVGDIQNGVSHATIAGRFHRTIAELLAQSCSCVRAQTNLREVALSGGVFQNQLLLKQLLARLQSLGFETYVNQTVPPNDGGLSFGQAAIAAAQLSAAC